MLCHHREITGETVNGGYAEYMVATADYAYRIPEGLDLIDAAPLFCPGITAFGAVEKLDVGPGDTVAIFGPGGVGHMAIQFAALTGARLSPWDGLLSISRWRWKWAPRERSIPQIPMNSPR